MQVTIGRVVLYTLNEADVYWATSRTEGDADVPGFWPPRV